MHEFYADTIPDWRTIFNLEHDDLVTSSWEPLANPPLTTSYYPVSPQLRRVPEAPLHPVGITGVTFGTLKFEAMRDFFAEVAGLTLMSETAGRNRMAVFSGATGRPDVTLSEVAMGEKIGIRRFSFQLTSENEIRDAVTELAVMDVPFTQHIDDDDRLSVILSDPDDFSVEFYWPRSGHAVPPLAA
jgi:hypothetical protein